MNSIVKNIALACFSLIIVQLSAQADSLDIKTGTQLLYKVKMNGDSFLFKATIVDTTENMVIDYLIDKKNATGIITLTAEAMEESYVHLYSLLGGHQTFTNTTILFFSRKSFAEILHGDTIEVSLDDNAPKEVKLLEEKEDNKTLIEEAKSKGNNYLINGFIPGNIEHVRVFANTDPLEHVYTILNNPKYPLITYMNREWSFELIEVTNP